MKLLRHYRPLLFILLLSSCSTKKDIDTYSDTFRKIILNEEGHFRGIEVGDKPEKVKASEKGNLTDESENYLYYDITLNETDYFTLAYYFDEKGLYEINADIFFENKEVSTTLFNQFSEYFTGKYGEHVKQEGYYIWKVKSDHSDNIEISLFNDMSQEGNGYLSINITDFEN